MEDETIFLEEVYSQEVAQFMAEMQADNSAVEEDNEPANIDGDDSDPYQYGSDEGDGYGTDYDYDTTVQEYE